MDKEQYQRISNLFRDVVSNGKDGFSVGSMDSDFFASIVAVGAEKTPKPLTYRTYTYNVVSGGESVSGTIDRYDQTRGALNTVCDYIENMGSNAGNTATSNDSAEPKTVKFGFGSQ